MKVFLLLSSVALLASCGPIARGGVRGGGGGGISSSCNGGFGQSQAALQLAAFIDASTRFHAAAFEAHDQLLSACRNTGLALGMSDSELSSDVRSTCATVQQRLHDEMASLRANYTVRVESQPPRCEVSVDAYGSCVAQCDASFDPGQAELTCEGGEIRGQCDAECRGSCAVDVSGQCSGTCEGACNGTCSATARDGSCAGTCNGTCEGRCVVSAQASCQGECRGGCSIAYREPYCTGRVRPPSASADCRASCDARIEAEARCTPGQMNVAIDGGLDGEQQARLARVQRAMREGVSQIVALRERIERLNQSGAEIIRLAPGVPRAVGQVSVNAAVCATAAAAATAEAAASLSVSVEVSVSFSASVSAG